MYNVQFVKCGTAAHTNCRLHTTGTLKFKGQVYRNISHSTLLYSYKVTTHTELQICNTLDNLDILAPHDSAHLF